MPTKLAQRKQTFAHNCSETRVSPGDPVTETEQIVTGHSMHTGLRCEEIREEGRDRGLCYSEHGIMRRRARLGSTVDLSKLHANT